MRRRLDAELVRRGLARSRGHAGDLLAAGAVRVAGLPAAKAASQVDEAAPITVSEDDDSGGWVGRGAHKLSGALDDLLAGTGAAPAVAGRRCLDCGASTGGFTEVLLRRGAEHVVAVDVGYGQLAWSLRTDPRVSVLDRTNARSLTPELLGGAVDLAVADLSFISLRLVLPALAAVLTPGGDVFCMVKPQFEAGRDALGPGGVVVDPEVRVSAVTSVAAAAADLELGLRAVVASPLPGPAGNVEYFTWLARGAGLSPAEAEAEVRGAVARGPAGRTVAAGGAA